MDNLKIWLLNSPYQDEDLLGRKVREYVEREFENLACEYVDDVSEVHPVGVSVVLPLSCPLATLHDVQRVVKSMKLRGVKRVNFRSSSAYIVRENACGEEIFADNSAFFEISDAKSFCLVYNIFKDRIVARHLANGVLIFDRATTFVDDTVEIGRGAKILPFCRIEGRSVVESGATISASYMRDSTVRAGAQVESSHVVDSVIGENATIGPFARLRGANVGRGCRIGDFVEVKASTIGDGTKSAHLTYIGDATVGERTNVGCGTVFCNYDGKTKHKTTVGSDCFIGANVNLVAPINIGDDCFVAAGTTISQDLADGTFAIGRAIAKTQLNTHKNN